MKIVAKQYAQALFSEIKDQAEKDISGIINNFVEILKKDNCLSQMEKIIFYFNEFWKKEYSLVEAEISTAREINSELKKDLVEYLTRISQAKKINIVEKENDKLIGGFVVKYNDKIIDASVKNKINKFKNSLIQ
ncbi:MAG TPA: F0F1 ATP synthase subunit delta [bacterium]|nr:F0F1 ATP synthase subunit delta [bacterium]